MAPTTAFPFAARDFVESATTHGIPVRTSQLDAFKQWRVGGKPVALDLRARDGALRAHPTYHVTSTGTITLRTETLEAAGVSLDEVYATAGMTLVSLEMPMLAARVAAARANDGALAETFQGLDPWWNIAQTAELLDATANRTQQRLARQMAKAAFFQFVNGTTPATLLPGEEHLEAVTAAVTRLESTFWRTDLWLDLGSSRRDRWKLAETAAGALSAEVLDLAAALCREARDVHPVFVDASCPVMLAPTERSYAFARSLATSAKRLVASATHVAQAPHAIPMVFACTGHQYACLTPVGV